MKKLLFIILILGCIGVESYSSHIIGGDITYRCLGGNDFEVILTLYQDCVTGDSSAVEQDNPASVSIYKNLSTDYTYYTFIQEYADLIEVVTPEFSSECVTSLPTTCLRKQVTKYNVTLPNSEFGYTLVYQRCCRNGSISNIFNPGQVGITYSANIPTVNGACDNSSPYFVEDPPQIICNNNPFSYNFQAIDEDGDSLVYNLCQSYLGGNISVPLPEGSEVTAPPFVSVTYNLGFSPTNPLPALPSIAINPTTGLMTMQPTSSGRYQVKICVDEYRDGVLLSSIARDLQFIIFDCNRLVQANIPLLSQEPNTYKVICDGFTTLFENNSTGGTSYLWDFGDGTTSTEFEPIHTYNDTGTYTVKLIVNQGEPCSDSMSRLMKVYPFLTAEMKYTGKFCLGELITFEDSVFSTLDYPITTIYDFGDGTTTSTNDPTHIYGDYGSYNVTFIASNELGCFTRIDSVINIPVLNTFAGNDTIVALYLEYYLNATGADNYKWITNTTMLSNPNIANPKVTFPDTGYYQFIVEGIYDIGCNDFDTINVLVVADPFLEVPNAFSPNGDGVNDTFIPVFIGYPYLNFFSIYNRYGERIFISYKNNEGWDGTFEGTRCEQGVYFYEISFKDINDNDVYKKGDVTLIR